MCGYAWEYVLCMYDKWRGGMNCSLPDALALGLVLRIIKWNGSLILYQNACYLGFHNLFIHLLCNFEKFI